MSEFEYMSRDDYINLEPGDTVTVASWLTQETYEDIAYGRLNESVAGSFAEMNKFAGEVSTIVKKNSSGFLVLDCTDRFVFDRFMLSPPVEEMEIYEISIMELFGGLN